MLPTCPTRPRAGLGAKLVIVLIVDVANVVGSRPTGWWRDRAGAARAFADRVRRGVADGRVDGPVVLVVEGRARPGVAAGAAGPGVEVVHAPAAGDDTMADLAAAHGSGAVVVTADRGLAARARAAGAGVVGPSWLLARLPD
ncbi:MAG TPA: hypothetical protein VFC99_07585 [Acidimicrobiia bacterium]|nr:hypothetical protein [Acidimicrobiia bacterium]